MVRFERESGRQRVAAFEQRDGRAAEYMRQRLRSRLGEIRQRPERLPHPLRAHRRFEAETHGDLDPILRGGLVEERDERFTGVPRQGGARGPRRIGRPIHLHAADIKREGGVH